MKLLLVESGVRGVRAGWGLEIWVGWGPGGRVLGDERYTDIVGMTIYTTFHVSVPSQS